MPVYTFKVRDGRGGAEDSVGVALHDRGEAEQYAQRVVRELMRARERRTRCWELEIYELGHGGEPRHVLRIPFATADPTLDHLAPSLRATTELACQRRGSLAEIIHAAKLTVRESRALIARSRGKLYVAAEFGERTIRDA
jgi:hypothetical protein